MASFAEVRGALVAVVSAAVPQTLSQYSYAADAVSLPAVLAVPATPFADYASAMDSAASARYRVRLVFLTGRIAEDAGQRLLDEWASADGPIIMALFAADLDAAEIVSVAGEEYGTVRVGATQYLGFSLLVETEA